MRSEGGTKSASATLSVQYPVSDNLQKRRSRFTKSRRSWRYTSSFFYTLFDFTISMVLSDCFLKTTNWKWVSFSTFLPGNHKESYEWQPRKTNKEAPYHHPLSLVSVLTGLIALRQRTDATCPEQLTVMSLPMRPLTRRTTWTRKAVPRQKLYLLQHKPMKRGCTLL